MVVCGRDDLRGNVAALVAREERLTDVRVFVSGPDQPVNTIMWPVRVLKACKLQPLHPGVGVRGWP